VQTFYGLPAIDPPLQASVLTVGNFDGVHRAHQRLLAKACALAREAGTRVVVLTFEPHPLTVVAPEKAPPCLTPLADKLAHLEAGGADITAVAKSEPALLTMTAEQFVEEVLVRRFHPIHVVEGPTFGFGRGRKGTPQLLDALSDKHGYQLHIVEPVTIQMEDGSTPMVSSSLIRRLLRDGQVGAAARCLTRPYSITGVVVPGRSMGRRMGFPTANLGPTDQVILGDGVYAGAATIEKGVFPCAMNLGAAPTFSIEQPRIEAHLLDFDGDLYGQSIRLTFLRRLRSQVKFTSAEALASQLRADVQAVRAGAQTAAVTSA